MLDTEAKRNLPESSQGREMQNRKKIEDNQKSNQRGVAPQENDFEKGRKRAREDKEGVLSTLRWRNSSCNFAENEAITLED